MQSTDQHEQPLAARSGAGRAALPGVAAPARRDSVVFVADHWGRHPSSAQHIARGLPADVDVLWLETAGLTRPSADLDTLRRGVDQLRRWFGPPAPAPYAGERNVRVLSPAHWPGWRVPLVRRLNGRTLGAAVDAARASTAGRRILVTALPLAATILEHVAFDRVVYYCVDDFALWPGANRAVQAELERRLLARSDVVIAASRDLEARLRRLGHDVHYLPHGVDAAHWRDGSAARPAVDAAAASMRRPILTFWGLVDRRLDLDWLRACQRATGGTVLLLGPQRAPHRALARLGGVVCAGPVPYADLPAWAAASDALIMPYADLPVTRAMQPLKMLEYLCTDRPVFLRDLPACREWADAADVVASADELCAALAVRLATGVPAAQLAARRRAAARGWPQVVERFWDIVSARGECEPSRAAADGRGA